MAPFFDTRPSRPRRVPLLGAFLVATVVLAAWLGWEAVAAAGSHRETAESVLRDYAGISAAAFSRGVSEDVDDVLDEVFDGVDGDLRAGRRLPEPLEFGRELDDAIRDIRCRGCRAFLSPVLLLSADLGGGVLRVRPDTVPRSLALEVGRAAARARPGLVGYAQGLLTPAAGELLPDAAVVGYAVARDSTGATRVLAFVVPPEALDQLLAHRFGHGRLIPEPIGGDLATDSLVQVTVRTADGRTLWTSPVEYPTTLAARRALGPGAASLDVEVAIRPDHASQLIIGGLPSSRLPLLGTLLALTLGVGIAAIVQLRQEARFQRLRDDFVSGVSHELRTPLAQIRMFAELQEMGRLSSPEDRARAASVIHREARRLSHLVENILQFSRLRRGPGMPREELELGEALSEGVDAVSSVLRDRSMRLRFSARPGIRVRANRDALTRIVVNLLDNAAKYGPEGQRVTVEVERSGAWARIAVTDQGPGVPAGDRTRIWKPYRRLERDVRGRRPGSGIGLAVVADLVELHGGRARVEGTEGGGARFVVELPLVEDEVDGEAERGRTGGATDGIDDGSPRDATRPIPAGAP